MFDWQPATKKMAMFLLAVLVLVFSCWVLDRGNFNRILNASWRILDEDSYFKQYTSPLSLDIARDLCAEFDLPISDLRCQERKIYALDFYPAIIEYYSVIPNKDRTLPVVQEKIGKYQIAVEKKIKNGASNYWYWYDFTGDQMFPLIIVFDENGTMVDIRSRAGRDS